MSNITLFQQTCPTRLDFLLLLMLCAKVMKSGHHKLFNEPILSYLS